MLEPTEIIGATPSLINSHAVPCPFPEEKNLEIGSDCELLYPPLLPDLLTNVVL
jgi:hypothetical protein